MLKRRFDKMLSYGHGKQLIWLFFLTLACIGIYIAIARLIIKDDFLSWQLIVGTFLDPGVYGSFYQNGHDLFRISIALLSVFLFSALLVSVFTNVFENISESVREGHRRYKLRGHVLILGAGRQLQGILNALKDDERQVVVMSEIHPEVDGDYIYYNGSRIQNDELVSANVTFADTIYIIGDDNEIGHDSKSLECLELINSLCNDIDHDIHCFLTLHERISTELFQYLKFQEGGRLLLVDVINDYDYEAERLLVNTDFLPVIKADSNKSSHIIIIGKSPAALAVAYTVAHISHYPNFLTKKKKTTITFVAEGMKDWMERVIASRPGLFELSEYSYIASDGNVSNTQPDSIYGDFLDVKWEFADTSEYSTLGRKLITSSVLSVDEVTTICVCHEKESEAVESVLHLPNEVYGRGLHDFIEDSYGAYNLAVYMRHSSEIINRANKTGMYGNITVFGCNDDITSDPLLRQRSLYGKRVNFVYDKEYGNPPSDNEDVAWYKIPEAHKYSSIYCANAMFLRRKCFDMDGDRLPVYEAEHRRWMMSELIMGYSAGSKTDKQHFVHEDIKQFDKLPQGEQDKDKILIDNMNYILGESN